MLYTEYIRSLKMYRIVSSLALLSSNCRLVISISFLDCRHAFGIGKCYRDEISLFWHNEVDRNILLVTLARYLTNIRHWTPMHSASSREEGILAASFLVGLSRFTSIARIAIVLPIHSLIARKRTFTGQRSPVNLQANGAEWPLYGR